MQNSNLEIAIQTTHEKTNNKNSDTLRGNSEIEKSHLISSKEKLQVTSAMN